MFMAGKFVVSGICTHNLCVWQEKQFLAILSSKMLLTAVTAFIFTIQSVVIVSVSVGIGVAVVVAIASLHLGLQGFRLKGQRFDDSS